MSYGWLCRDPSSENVLEGFTIDREKFRTRFEEYGFALDALSTQPPGVAVDAGAGFNSEIHNLAYMLERRGWTVIATDVNPESLDMPPTMNVSRWIEDITVGRYTRGLEVDAYCCISTLEHLQPMQQLMLMETAYETVRVGGVAVFTADFVSPKRLAALLRYGGFDVGEESWAAPLTGELLVPRVAFAVGRKLK